MEKEKITLRKTTITRKGPGRATANDRGGGTATGGENISRGNGQRNNASERISSGVNQSREWQRE